MQHRYHDIALDVIPIHLGGDLNSAGVLYISDRHIPDVNTTGVVDIFVRRVLVRANDASFLPPWAKFVRGVIDSPDLQPTAARDGVQTEPTLSPSYRRLQAAIGRLIIDRLIELSREDPVRFRQINRWHHYHLKGMAFYHEEFFTAIIEHLVFETNSGHMTLAEYATKNARRPSGLIPIYYFAYRGGEAVFYRLANAKGLVVVNAGRRFDEELLEKFVDSHSDTYELVRLDASDDPGLFERLERDEAARFTRLEVAIEGVLRRNGAPEAHVRTRRYAPAELPALIVLTPESDAELKLREIVTQPLFVTAMEDIATEVLQQARRRPLYLTINSANHLIQALADEDGTDGTMAELYLGLHNSAVLYSYNLLTEDNATLIHGQLVRFFETVLELRHRGSALQVALENERREVQSLSAVKPIPDDGRITVFMITPFDDAYRNVEAAVRRVLELPPYLFEVRLARDYTLDGTLLGNVRAHIQAAHAFVADITTLNPNVMFELGAALLGESGPVFALRGSDAASPVPSDILERLYIPYGRSVDPIPKIEASIRKAIERDGRPAHEELRLLHSRRRAGHLSHMLLSELSSKLTDKQADGILREFRTVEQLTSATDVEISDHAHCAKWLAGSIRSELSEMLGASSPTTSGTLAAPKG